MDAIEILKRCRSAKTDIGRMQEREARLRECATSTTANLEKIGGKPGSVSDKVSAFAVEIAESEQWIAERRRAYEAELLAACRIVDALPEPECGVIYRYYVQGHTQSGIAKTLNYSIGYVKKKKQSGLRLLAGMKADDLLPEWYCEEPAWNPTGHGGSL